MDVNALGDSDLEVSAAPCPKRLPELTAMRSGVRVTAEDEDVDKTVWETHRELDDAISLTQRSEAT
eukprot:scaffold51779_cov49-Prasinocladus_malaysianus.AAC.2